MTLPFSKDIYITDNVITWRPYDESDIICENFSYLDWKKIVMDINNDIDWRIFLQNYNDIVTCFTLYQNSNSQNIGFAYIYSEDYEKKIVSIHGGGWLKNIKASMLYYRGFFLLIKKLLNNGFKVRTSCLIDNKEALRFIKSTGFVNYYTSKTLHHFWINARRLENNLIYQWLNKKV